MSEKIITFGDSTPELFPQKGRLNTTPFSTDSENMLAYREYCFHQHIKGDAPMKQDNRDIALSRLTKQPDAQRNSPDAQFKTQAIPISPDTGSALFGEYGAIVSVEDVMKMLHLGQNKVYELLKSGALKTIRCGKKYIIPKQSVIDFISLK